MKPEQCTEVNLFIYRQTRHTLLSTLQRYCHILNIYMSILANFGIFNSLLGSYFDQRGPLRRGEKGNHKRLEKTCL